jgi:ribosomal silencing factor RsfS
MKARRRYSKIYEVMTKAQDLVRRAMEERSDDGGFVLILMHRQERQVHILTDGICEKIAANALVNMADAVEGEANDGRSRANERPATIH